MTWDKPCRSFILNPRPLKPLPDDGWPKGSLELQKPCVLCGSIGNGWYQYLGGLIDGYRDGEYKWHCLICDPPVEAIEFKRMKAIRIKIERLE